MDIHSKLQTLDLLVIAGYLIALVTIGMWVSFRRRGARDLFLGGRSQGWLVVGLSIFGTNVNPSFLISSCKAGYRAGFASANFEWLAWLLMMLLAMLIVGPSTLIIGERKGIIKPMVRELKKKRIPPISSSILVALMVVIGM